MSLHIVIVGSGVAAAIVAKNLLEKGTRVSRVTLLEAGSPVPQMDRRKWIDYVTTWKLPYDSNNDVKADYESRGAGPIFEGGRLFARGGSTMHWGGWAFRYKPEDFRTGSGSEREVDWPFGYEELEEYYWQAEYLLGVAGDSTEDDPPRFGRQYPFKQTPMVLGDTPVLEALGALGINHGHFPIARFADRCVTTGTCRYCPVGGRYSATQTVDELEQRFSPSGRFEVRTGATVQNIVPGGGYRARGVSYLDVRSGTFVELQADVVIICAGAIETPKILLSSRSEIWPYGLGNASGHVGRHFKIHPMLFVDATFRSNPNRILQELDFPTLACRHYDTPREQRDGKLFFARTSRFPQVDVEGMIQRGVSRTTIDSAVRGQHTVTLSGFIEEFSTEESSITLAPGFTRFGTPRTAVTYAPVANQVAVDRHLNSMAEVLTAAGATVTKTGVYDLRIDHTASTTRMGNDERDSVVDPDLRVHGTDNVYVCSTAVFPTIAAVPPTLTLAAIALRLSDHLVKNVA